MTGRRSLAALALTASLALAACGNNVDGDTSDNADSTGTAASTPTGTAVDTSADDPAADSDLPAVGETISIDKADITVDNLRAFDRGTTTQVCADVNFTVTSETEPLQVRGLAAWKLYDPQQLPRTQTVSEETDHVLDEVGPGQSEDGTICFDGPADPGEYRLSFQENFDAQTERAEWIGTL
ncbi:hypothetical protein [Corynebacterium kalidii]|uniref:DUF4352 domain-containing protein n=1 Tax=Corynebacterium kalidii TaxID=2931982 RepID=A0A9X1WFU9_9CORY|nr:hypothetical protein [Corynebacterium kalidii]MCJ7858249.1 hypothetical protein [Corynebacterium kalidii]